VNPRPDNAYETMALRVDALGPVVLPALLLCDFGHLAREIIDLQEAGAAALHLDVMDGRFVRQLTYGLPIVVATRTSATVPIEVHLMVEEPEQTLADYAAAGANIVTVHLESLAHPLATLKIIKSLGPRAHLAINPETPVEKVLPFLDHCDGVLVMSVSPGLGGQAFNPVALEKLRFLTAVRAQEGLALRLAVDGGISTETVGLVAAAGADFIVAGTAVIRSGNYAHALANLEQIARDAMPSRQPIQTP